MTRSRSAPGSSGPALETPHAVGVHRSTVHRWVVRHLAGQIGGLTAFCVSARPRVPGSSTSGSQERHHAPADPAVVADRSVTVEGFHGTFRPEIAEAGPFASLGRATGLEPAI